MSYKSSPEMISRLRTGSRRDGVALVIVLGMLVVLSGLLVAFMSTAMTERSAAQAGNDGAAARQIADSTVNLVMAQIREATTQPEEDSTWASQPGAIRTFQGKLGGKQTLPRGANAYDYELGQRDRVFKLYSADQMGVPTAEYETSDLPAEVKVIEEWDREKPAPEYADLNEPILSQLPGLAEGVVEPRYPIVDPRAKYRNGGEVENTTPESGIVDGFDVKTSGFIDPGLKLKGGGGVPYLPMPVKWLYVLRDGTIGPASLGSKDNPIVGRTAFWTDDESTKLNINTASEGTFWDTPTASGENESGNVSTGGDVTSSATSFSLAASQPTRGEYQRYSGHPATTCLSPVLGWAWNVTPNTPLRPRQSADYLRFKEAIYQVSPFLPFGKGTSMGGTRNSDTSAPALDEIPKLHISRKALYTNVDGLLFKPERFQGGNPVLNEPLNAEALEKVRFFLTASSRAPEITLMSRPRVTIWPVNADASLRTSYDDLFAFTSTLGGSVTDPNSKKYFLSRQEAKSATYDIDSIPRNRELFDYLKWSTDQTIPGFGGSFAAKYNYTPLGGVTERDQILTEIFDYTRTVNLVDTGTRRASAAGFRPYTPFFGEGQAGYGTVSQRSFDWSGQVTPIRINGTAGIGRFFTITEAALQFYRAGAVPNPVGSQKQKQNQMQAILLLELTTPTAGFPAIRETYWTRISASPALITPRGMPPRPLNLCSTPTKPKPLINIPNVSSHEVSFGRGFMPTLGVATAFHYFPEHRGTTDPARYPNDPNRTATTGVTLKQFVNSLPESMDGNYRRNRTIIAYPYVSDLIPIDTANEFMMQQVSFSVEVFTGESPEDPRSQLVQTVNFTFPAATLPVPDGEPGIDVSFGKRFTERPINKENNRNNYIRSYDTVRSVELVGAIGTNDTPLLPTQGGDVRVAMTRPVVPASFFQPRGGIAAYMNRAERRVHGLMMGHGDPLSGFWPPDRGPTGSPTRGRLGAGTALRGSKPPALPANVNGVRRRDNGPGDWDRGISKHTDGALANKVDEGNVYFNYNDNNEGGRLPYFRGRGIEEVGRSFFTPNRQLPSAVMFGSLPTGALEGKQWQTLLFRPDREMGPGHPGGKIPPDHLLLDLFHIPIVEPYAISEPFSTAGKINLNHVIAPFGYAKGDAGNNPRTTLPRSYLRRDTALRGVLKSTKMMAVKTNEVESGHREQPVPVKSHFRFDIDLDRTLEQFEARIKDPRRGLFRSASEICDMDLFPASPHGPATSQDAPQVSSWPRFWDVEHALTGDNMRERPYAHIYPRITTRSNVYTVHMRCQAIRKSPKSEPDEFDELKDSVVSEYRGSTTIERFIDPNDPQLRNYDERKTKLDPYYRFRVVATKHFAPR